MTENITEKNALYHQAYSLYDSAIVLIEHHKIRDSMSMIYEALITFERLMEHEGKNDSEQSKVFAKHAKNQDIWYTDKIELIRRWRDDDIASADNLLDVVYKFGLLLRNYKSLFLKENSGLDYRKSFLKNKKYIIWGIIICCLFVGSLLIKFTVQPAHTVESIQASGGVYMGDYLKGATVYQVNASGATEYAEYQNNSWVFQGMPPRWSTIRLRGFQIDGKDRAGIYFHPYEAGPRIIKFNNIKIAKKLVLFFGLDDRRSTSGGDVNIKVIINNKLIKEIDHDGQGGWRRAVVDMTAYQGQRHDVIFEVRTDAQHGRHLCIAPYMVES